MKTTIRSGLFYFLIQGGFIVVLLMVAALIIAGFIPIRHAWFSEKAVLLIKKMGADSCIVKSVEVVAWKSIELQGVLCTVGSDSGNGYKITVSKATFSGNIIQCFLQRKKLYQAIYTPSLSSRQSFLSQPQTIASGMLTLADIMKEGIEVDFKDVWLTVKTEGKTAFSGIGGEITLSREKEKDFVSLTAHFPVITTYGDGMQDIQCTALLTSEGTIAVQNLSGMYFDGKLRARGMIDLANRSSATYSLMVDKMDMAYWYAVHVGVGEITGRALLHCKGDNIPLQQIGSRLNCTATISDCSVTNLPMQHSLATSLFIPSLTTVKFDKLAFSIRKTSGDTIYASSNGRGDELTYTSNGWVLVDGRIGQQIKGVFSESMVKKLPPNVRSIFASGKDQSWRFGCRLHGTYTDPRFELDKETLQRAVGGFLRSFQDEIMRTLMK